MSPCRNIILIQTIAIVLRVRAGVKTPCSDFTMSKQGTGESSAIIWTEKLLTSFLLSNSEWAVLGLSFSLFKVRDKKELYSLKSSCAASSVGYKLLVILRHIRVFIKALTISSGNIIKTRASMYNVARVCFCLPWKCLCFGSVILI